MYIAERYLMVAVLSIVLLCGLLFVPAFGQHRPEHMMLHEKFYNTWMMPDNPGVSCCNDKDCEPAEAYQKDGIWYARKISEIKEHPEYTRIPPAKIEQNRDSPDGQSHICGRRYGFNNMDLSVFCFVPGFGG